MPVIKYNNVELGRLSDVPVGSSIDVVGILKECLPIQSITTKKQSQVNKRDIAIVDMSGWLVRCTLWGEQADSFDHTGTPVVAFKGLKVSDFNGRSLGCSDTTAIAINPDIPEAHRLRGWYDATGHGLAFESYSRDGATGSSSTPMLTISDITDNGLGLGEKPDYLAMYGTVSYVRSENPWYPACPNAGCNKKVMDLGGEWRCEKCDMQFPAPNYRYILSFTVCDPTGQIWLQAFNDDAESMIGRTADEMSQLKVNNLMQEADELGYKQVFQQLLYQEFHFKCRAKQEMYQDEAKMRISTVKITKMDYAARCKELLANIASLA